ncbi:flagellar basal body-associated protein FliL [Bartonella sp. DGB2]|uniref:flagellar basal body-associated FliL family protein n=1 Tax=Bartonella sp. DGB2 TaxID=3388426 RepID=UPI00398FE028
MAKAAKMNEKGKTGGSTGRLIIATLILTLISAAGGWFLGQQIRKDLTPPAIANLTPEVTQKSHVDMVADTNLVALPPILTNLAAPDTAWIRMEASLVFNEDATIKPENVAEISNDFMAFLRESAIDRLKGASGLMNLRADLLDRARIRSQGKVRNVLILSLVIEQ